jgi:hypothetical protein
MRAAASSPAALGAIVLLAETAGYAHQQQRCPPTQNCRSVFHDDLPDLHLARIKRTAIGLWIRSRRRISIEQTCRKLQPICSSDL